MITKRAEHTAGPWKYAPLLDRITEPSGQAIARTFAGPWDAEEEDANAKLIAAAPEMLEALKKALTCGLGSDVRELVINAIQKARGEA